MILEPELAELVVQRVSLAVEMLLLLLLLLLPVQGAVVCCAVIVSGPMAPCV